MEEDSMQVQVNTDRNIDGGEDVVALVAAIVRGELDRFAEQITRVEVHLRDENSNKKGGSDDVRCMMEARLAGLQPLAVTHDAATLEEAASGAAAKMKRQVDSTLGRMSEY
jgi:hypothetical protein